MTPELHRVVYCSRGDIARDPSRARGELQRILAISRKNNAAAGLSGALIFANGNFAQALDGRAPRLRQGSSASRVIRAIATSRCLNSRRSRRANFPIGRWPLLEIPWRISRTRSPSWSSRAPTPTAPRAPAPRCSACCTGLCSARISGRSLEPALEKARVRRGFTKLRGAPPRPARRFRPAWRSGRKNLFLSVSSCSFVSSAAAPYHDCLKCCPTIDDGEPTE